MLPAFFIYEYFLRDGRIMTGLTADEETARRLQVQFERQFRRLTKFVRRQLKA